MKSSPVTLGCDDSRGRAPCASAAVASPIHTEENHP